MGVFEQYKHYQKLLEAHRYIFFKSYYSKADNCWTKAASHCWKSHRNNETAKKSSVL